MLLAMNFGTPESGEWMLGWAGLFVLIFVVLALVQAALQGIFSAALYHYAVDGESSDDNAAETQAMVGAFKTK